MRDQTPVFLPKHSVACLLAGLGISNESIASRTKQLLAASLDQLGLEV